MTADQKASTTMIWLKQLTTSTFIAMEYIDGMNLGQIMARLKTGLQISYDASDLSDFMRKTFEHA